MLSIQFYIGSELNIPLRIEMNIIKKNLLQNEFEHIISKIYNNYGIESEFSTAGCV